MEIQKLTENEMKQIQGGIAIDTNAQAGGIILSGHLDNGSENLDIDHPLASGFSIGSGSVKVVLPKDVAPRDDYFVVLFGDSGDKSRNFRIGIQ